MRNMDNEKKTQFNVRITISRENYAKYQINLMTFIANQGHFS